MPLDKSGSKASVGNNIRAELNAGKPRRQAIAIALDVARRTKRADGGLISGLLDGGRQADDARWRDMVQNAAGGSFGRQAASMAGDPGASVNAAQARDMGNAASGFMGSSTLPMDDPRWRRAGGGNVNQTPWYERDEARNLGRMPKIGATMGGVNVSPVMKGNLAVSTPVGQAIASSAKVGSVKPNFPKLPNPPKLPKMKSGGEVEKSHGLLTGSTPGRADKINTSVRDNTFIIPAHVVSILGEGSTMAGGAKLDRMFPPISRPSKSKKDGGAAHSQVKVALSDGEYRVSPEQVLKVGKGDFEAGHRILKKFCETVTHKGIEQLRKMPSPVDSGDE